MKKKIILSFTVLFVIILYVAGLNSSEKINWPDFIRLNDKFYLNTDIALNVSDIDNKIGTIQSNSPEKSCKWVPINNESGKVPIGTEVYSSINNNLLIGVCVYIDNNYIYYEEISEDDLYELVIIK